MHATNVEHYFLIFEIKSSTLIQYFKGQMLLHKSIYSHCRNCHFNFFFACALYKTLITLYRILIMQAICIDSDWNIIKVLYDLHRNVNYVISIKVHYSPITSRSIIVIFWKLIFSDIKSLAQPQNELMV